jgi:hypothetical protein
MLAEVAKQDSTDYKLYLVYSTAECEPPEDKEVEKLIYFFIVGNKGKRDQF